MSVFQPAIGDDDEDEARTSSSQNRSMARITGDRVPSTAGNCEQGKSAS